MFECRGVWSLELTGVDAVIDLRVSTDDAVM
jgi:hypothetical protein